MEVVFTTFTQVDERQQTILVSTPLVRRWAVCLVIVASVSPLFAQKGQKEGSDLAQRAAALFEEGRFAEAYPLYSQLVSLKPTDPDLNFRFGATALYAGVAKENAIKHLSFAVKKNCADVRVYFYLGKAHHLNYEFTEAAQHYRTYLKKRDPKEKQPLDAERNLRMCEQGNALLSNIRDVVVLEKTEASLSDFFRYYNLEEIGGRVLRTPEELLSKYDKKVGLLSTMHYPGDALTIYFTSYGKDGKSGKDLYRADILPGGSYSTPERLPDVINTDDDEDFAFMHPDGRSFYFASRGHNSMGGFDIFRSAYDPVTDTFSKPVNLDFAINTPDDDLFYVVDSLKQTAYFASKRNSSQGSVHVYKVLVNALPVNLTFIAGNYITEAPGLDDQAKITVIDELTGRTVTETQASVKAGGYLLELPKAGVYSIHVQPKGSAVKHAGVFTVPNYDKSVALGQELRIVNDGGLEKLVITNSFDLPLDVDLAQLAADALRKRAALDVNATDDRIKAAEELNDPGNGLREEKTEDELVVSAGFERGTTLAQVNERLTQRAHEQEAIASRMEEQAVVYLQEAASEQKKARKTLAQAQAFMERIDRDDASSYATALREYNGQLDEANRSAKRAIALVEAAEKLNKQSVVLKANTGDLRTRSGQISLLIENGEQAKAIDELAEVHRMFSKAPTDNNPAKVAVELAIEQEQKSLASISQRLATAEEDTKALERRREQVQRERDATTRKSLKVQLDIDLEAIDERIAANKLDVLNAQERLKKSERKLSQLLSENALIVEALFANAAPNNVPFDEALAQQLKSDLDDDFGKLEVLTIDEQKAHWEADEQAGSRFDIALIPAVAAKSSKLNIDLKPLELRQESYELALKQINDRGVAPEAQRLALKAIETESVSRQIQLLNNIDLAALSLEEQQIIGEEINRLKAWAVELHEALPPKQTTPTDSETLKMIQMRYPDYAQTRSDGGRSDLMQMRQRIEIAQRIENELRTEQVNLRQALIDADDAAEAQAIERELQQVEAFMASVSADTEVQKLLMAWENDRKELLEENESYASLMRRQIALTETYLDGLDALNAKAVEFNNDEERMRIEELSEQALVKLNEQRDELALLVNVSDDKAADSSSTETSAGIETLPVTNDERQAEIDQMVRRIDATDDEAERDRLMADLTLLRNSASANKSVVVLTPPLDFDEQTSVEAIASFALLDERLKRVDGYLAQKNVIDEKTIEIAEIDEQIKAADKSSSIKRLDRKREEAFLERSEALIERSKLAASPLNVAYHENREEIRLQFERMSLNADQRKVIGTHLATQQREAEMAMERASGMRKQYAKERDDIKKAAYFDQALELELKAIASQDRLLMVLGQRENLISMSAQTLEAWLSGVPIIEADDSSGLELADNVNVVPDNDSSEQVEAEPMPATEKTSNDALENDAPAVDQEVTPVVVNESLGDDDDDDAKETQAAFIDEADQSADGDERIQLAMVEKKQRAEERVRSLKEASLSVDLTKVSSRREAVPVPESLVSDDEIVGLNNERETALRLRNAVVNDIEDLKRRITSMEKAVINAESQAEEEGLAQELRTLYRNAEVRYAELADADNQLDAIDAQIEVRLAEVIDRKSELAATNEPVAETLRDAAARAVDSRASAANSEEANSTESMREPTTSNEVLTSPKDDVLSNSSISKSMYYFALPEVLIESIFDVSSQPVYTKEQPIPIDATMPEGLMFKVQVGAFRNPIDQDLFGGFTPLMGERLSSGIVRYTAGAFVAFNEADEAKRQIRQLGYRDAFVVGYFNGKRISLAEAKALAQKTDMGLVASSQKDAVSAVRSAASTEQMQAAPASVTPLRGEAQSVASITPTTSEAPIVTKENANVEVKLPTFASNWRESTGVWLTVQIGVYSKPVGIDELYRVNDVMAEVLDRGLVRYTSGKYNTIDQANSARDRAREAGIRDAFVTAYIDGQRVPLSDAVPLLNNGDTESKPEASVAYQLVIGPFQGQVPAETARALLMLESTWGIRQFNQSNGTVYQTRPLTSEAEAERAREAFKELGVTKLSVEAIRR